MRIRRTSESAWGNPIHVMVTRDKNQVTFLRLRAYPQVVLVNLELLSSSPYRPNLPPNEAGPSSLPWRDMF